MKRKYSCDIPAEDLIKVTCAVCGKNIVRFKEEFAPILGKALDFGVDIDEAVFEREEGPCKPWTATATIGGCNLEGSRWRSCLCGMRLQIIAAIIILCIAKTAIAGSGFEPVISGAIDDIVNETVSKDTINKTSDRISKFGDVYGSARSAAGNIKEITTGTKTSGVKPEKKGLTFWQKIDRLILRTRNSNY